MSRFTVDSFIVELGFNENVIKGLQRVEKAALQSAQRIERNLNRAFKVNPKSMDKDLTASLGNMEKKINQTFNKLGARPPFRCLPLKALFPKSLKLKDESK